MALRVVAEYDIDFNYCRGAGIKTREVYRSLIKALKQRRWKHMQYSVWSKRRAAGSSNFAAECAELNRIADALEARFDPNPNGVGGGRQGLFKRFHIQLFTRHRSIRR